MVDRSAVGLTAIVYVRGSHILRIGANMLEIHNVCGVETRVTDIMPEEIIGINNGRYLVLFWEGAEIARIMPYPGAAIQLPQTGLLEDGDFDL